MLYPRIIPVLLVHNKGLVKTVKFKEYKYIGDPINAVRIFNEQQADELVVLDIDATVEGRSPDYKMIENLSLECRMPLCYGGGIKNIDQALKILSLGVEKISLNSSALENPQIISKLSKQVGNQSVVVSLDAKRKLFSNRYECYTHNGKKGTRINPIEFAQLVEHHGAGELIINSIDNDGIMEGYDLELIHKVNANVHIPVTVLGGAGSLGDISALIEKEQIIGAAAGSLFVFKGKYRAVLINYPAMREKEKLFEGLSR